MSTQLGMEKELMLKRYPYCNINNTLIKEDIYKFNDIDEFIDYIKQSCVDKDDRLFYGEYYIDINMAMSLEEIKKYIEGTITDIQEYEVKDKLVRGLRRNANFYEESARDFKPNNIYLNQEERKIITTQMKYFISDLQNKIDNDKYGISEKYYKIIDTIKNLLNDIEISNTKEMRSYDYYLTIDLSRDGDNKAILFKRYEDSLKIERFVSFHEKDCTNMVRKFLEEIKGLNCAILIPTVGFGGLIVDYFKTEGFEDIIEVSPRDIYKAMCSNDLYIGKNCDESYIRSLFYTTSKLGFKL